MVRFVLGYESNGTDTWHWVQTEIGIGWIEQIVRDVLTSFKGTLEDAWLPGAVQYPNDFRDIATTPRAILDLSLGTSSELLGVGHEYRARINSAVEVLLQARVGDGEKPLFEIVSDLFTSYRYKTVGVCEYESPRIQYKRNVRDYYEMLLSFPFRSYRMLERIEPTFYQSGWAGQARSEATLRLRFKRLFEDVTGLPVSYDNENETPPADGSPWIRLSIQAPSFDLEEPGPRAYRLRGQIAASIMVKSGTGINQSAVYADQIFDAMRTVSENETTLRLPAPVFSGRRGAWWQTTMVCPFYADEVV